MYYNGKLVSQDRTKVQYWYRKAAEQGDTDAQCMFEIMYKNKDGVTQEKAETAELGYGDAQFMLGFMLEKGEGVKQNAVEAVRWYRKAAKQKNSSAQIRLKDNYNINEVNY